MWNSSNYGNDLNITKNDALSCTHMGDCEADVRLLMTKPSIRRQLNKLDKDKLKTELSDYGCYTDEQLDDHEQNKMRWLWFSCSDIVDRG